MIYHNVISFSLFCSYDTCNPVFGQTYNPHGVGRNAGGSSGGESALIGGGGSLLGLAADIGGSIRIPSSMCGVCGFKPTSGRGSTRGTNPAIKGQNVSTFHYSLLIGHTIVIQRKEKK